MRSRHDGAIMGDSESNNEDPQPPSERKPPPPEPRVFPAELIKEGSRPDKRSFADRGGPDRDDNSE